MRLLVFIAAVAFSVSGASAQPQIVPRAAPNGVTVDVGTDDFAGLKAVSSPIIPFAAEPQGKGKFQVEQRISRGEKQALVINGYVIYPDNDWRFYEQAIYKGGDVARYKRTSGEVINCQATYFSDQKGCSFTEDFTIETTPDEIAAHAGADGSLDVRVTDRRGETFTLTIPLSYFTAVEQVADAEASLPK